MHFLFLLGLLGELLKSFFSLHIIYFIYFLTSFSFNLTSAQIQGSPVEHVENSILWYVFFFVGRWLSLPAVQLQCY